MADWKEILRRARQGATKTGVPLEVYLAHVAAGEARCTGCSKLAQESVWHPVSAFGMDLYNGCRLHSCSKTIGERGWKAAARWARKHGHPGRCLDQREGCYTRWRHLDHRHCACGKPMAPWVARCGRCERFMVAA